MDMLNMAVVLIGALVLVVGMFTNVIQRIWLSEPLLAMLFGIAIGPVGLGLLKSASSRPSPSSCSFPSSSCSASSCRGRPGRSSAGWSALLLVAGVL